MPLYIQRFFAGVVDAPDPDATGGGGEWFFLPFIEHSNEPDSDGILGAGWSRLSEWQTIWL